MLKQLTFLILTFFGNVVYCQSNTSIHFFKEIGCTIKVPSDFTLFDSTTTAQIVAIGKQSIEGTMNKTINTAPLKGLIAMSKKKLEYFSASLNTDTSITQQS